MIATQVRDDKADAVGSNTIDIHVGQMRAKPWRHRLASRPCAAPGTGRSRREDEPGAPTARRVRRSGRHAGRHGVLRRRRRRLEPDRHEPPGQQDRPSPCRSTRGRAAADARTCMDRARRTTTPTSTMPRYSFGLSLPRATATALTSTVPPLPAHHWGTDPVTLDIGSSAFRFDTLRTHDAVLVAARARPPRRTCSRHCWSLNSFSA